MKIENIIDDIKNDMMELRDRLEERFKVENPDLVFSVNLPGIDELATVKSIELQVEEGAAKYYFSVQIHTHNGNRVFESEAKEAVDDQLFTCNERHPFQVRFVNLLRDIIKKRKNKIKAKSKSGNLYNNTRQYANTA